MPKPVATPQSSEHNSQPGAGYSAPRMQNYGQPQSYAPTAAAIRTLKRYWLGRSCRLQWIWRLQRAQSILINQWQISGISFLVTIRSFSGYLFSLSLSLLVCSLIVDISASNSFLARTQFILNCQRSIADMHCTIRFRSIINIIIAVCIAVLVNLSSKSDLRALQSI